MAMKILIRVKSLRRLVALAPALTISLVIFALLPAVQAVSISPGSGGGGSAPPYVLFDSWSFRDNTNWTSDKGYAPVAFTNLDYSYLGNGSSLVVDSPGSALLKYNVVENDGTTNLTVDSGSLLFWFAPSWSGTNQGGNGPGQWGRLFEVGSYTPDSSCGWWSLYVDPEGNNIYFSTQTNDLSSNLCTYLSAPIAWTTNYFHFVALTYSATNTALYLDGVLATNGPPLTNYPGPDVLANGLFIGSDSNGVNQAAGLFNTVQTFSAPIPADAIQQAFNWNYSLYMINPANRAMFHLSSANSSPSTSSTPNVITGQGNLQIIGGVPVCVPTTTNQVWITNITASVANDGTMTVTFAIEGGLDGFYYDVFVGTSLTSPLGNAYWTWQGQGPHCLVYSMTGLPQGTVFIVLGTPQDTDGDGLTDAYENLVSHTNPDNPDSDGDGIPDGWSVLLGVNPLNGIGTQTSARANYGYTTADWLNQVSGVRSGSVNLDSEGNVLSVSQ